MMSGDFERRFRSSCKDRDAGVVWTYDAGLHVTEFIFADTSSD